MHLFVDVETVKRAAVTKRGASEWGVVSQVRIGRFAEAWVPAGARGTRSASPTPSPAVADAGAGCCCRTGSRRWHLR